MLLTKEQYQEVLAGQDLVKRIRTGAGAYTPSLLSST